MARPIKIEWNTIDWIIDGVTLFILMGIMVYTAIHYSTLPNTIPTNYGFSGQADGYGGKSILLVLLCVLMAMYLLLLGVSRIPHKFNYVTEITELNAPRQYSIALSNDAYCEIDSSDYLAISF